MSFATEQVELLKQAYRAVVQGGQTFRYGERLLTSADAAWISSELDKWLRRLAAEQRNASGSADYAVADFSRPHGFGFRVCD